MQATAAAPLGQSRFPSTSMPRWLIFVFLGVWYCAIVTTTAEPSSSSSTVCMTALPNVLLPSSVARPLRARETRARREMDQV